jgi:quinolinate synthase
MELWVEHPKSEVIAHPECEEALLNLADFVGSTSALLRRVQESTAESFIVLTEPGIIHKMKQVAPNKVFLQVPGRDGCSCNDCPWMKLNTLEKVRNCLRDLTPEINLEEGLRLRALKPLERMLSLS